MDITDRRANMKAIPRAIGQQEVPASKLSVCKMRRCKAINIAPAGEFNQALCCWRCLLKLHLNYVHDVIGKQYTDAAINVKQWRILLNAHTFYFMDSFYCLLCLHSHIVLCTILLIKATQVEESDKFTTIITRQLLHTLQLQTIIPLFFYLLKLLLLMTSTFFIFTCQLSQ